MLSTAARGTLRDVLPHENKPADLRGFDLTWNRDDGATFDETIVANVDWARQDLEPEYPQITLEINPDGVHREDLLPLDEVIRREARPDDPTIAYEEFRGEPLYSILNVIVEVARDHGQIRKSIVAHKLASQVYSFYRFETGHLRRQGDDGEWPLIVRPVGEGVRPLPDEGDGDVERYHMQFRVEYELTQAVLVEALADFEYEIIVTQ